MQAHGRRDDRRMPRSGFRPRVGRRLQSGRTTDRRDIAGTIRDGTDPPIFSGDAVGRLATCHPCDRRPQFAQRRNIAPFSHQTEYWCRPVSLHVNQLAIGAYRRGRHRPAQGARAGVWKDCGGRLPRGSVCSSLAHVNGENGCCRDISRNLPVAGATADWREPWG